MKKSKKVCILTSREIGDKCVKWAQKNTPMNCFLTDNIEEADIVISVMYDKIIKPKYVNNKICFNFHPGVLPEYRGSGAFSWVILNKEKKVGITLHLMDEGIDTGEVIEIREFLISKEDTAHSLFLRGEKVIYKMFKDWYKDLVRGDYISVPQDLSLGKTYYRKDLQKVKNLTDYAKAFYFPGKECAYYYNEDLEKIYLKFKEKR